MQTKLEKVVRRPLMSTPDSNSIHCCGQAPSASQDSIGTAPIPAGYKTSSVWSCWACLHYPLQHSVKGDFFSSATKEHMPSFFLNDQSPKVDVLEEFVVIMLVLEYCPRGVTVGFVHAARVRGGLIWLLWLLLWREV